MESYQNQCGENVCGEKITNMRSDDLPIHLCFIAFLDAFSTKKWSPRFEQKI